MCTLLSSPQSCSVLLSYHSCSQVTQAEIPCSTMHACSVKPSMKYHSGPNTALSNQGHGALQYPRFRQQISCSRISDASLRQTLPLCITRQRGLATSQAAQEQGRPANATLLTLARGRENDYEDVTVSPDLPRAVIDQVHRSLQRINRADQEQGVALLACPQKDLFESPTKQRLVVGWARAPCKGGGVGVCSSASPEPAGPRIETRLLASGSRGWDRIKLGTPWTWLPVSPLPGARDE
jgi:hypothetical protein